MDTGSSAFAYYDDGVTSSKLRYTLGTNHNYKPRHTVVKTENYVNRGTYRTLLQELHSECDTPIGIALGQLGRVTDENNTVEDRGSDPHIR